MFSLPFLFIALAGCGQIPDADDVDIQAEVFNVFPMEVACTNVERQCDIAHEFPTFQRFEFWCDTTLNQKAVSFAALECIATASDCTGVNACHPAVAEIVGHACPILGCDE